MVKKIRKKFYLSDFEEEQAFLSSQHSAGWRLTEIRGKNTSLKNAIRNLLSIR